MENILLLCSCQAVCKTTDSLGSHNTARNYSACDGRILRTSHESDHCHVTARNISMSHNITNRNFVMSQSQYYPIVTWQKSDHCHLTVRAISMSHNTNQNFVMSHSQHPTIVTWRKTDHCHVTVRTIWMSCNTNRNFVISHSPHPIVTWRKRIAVTWQSETFSVT